MLKRLKSVSMLLFLMGASTGAAYAVANPGVTDVKITQQTGTCKGVVVDATGETVIGASVVVKGTTNGTITGIDGDFSLSGVKQGDVIQVSFVGYLTQEIKFKGESLKIILQEDSQTLQEVVVVGYGGVQKAKTMTASAATVKMSELAKLPVASMSEGLGGALFFPFSMLLIYCPDLLIAAASSSCVRCAAIRLSFRTRPKSDGSVKASPPF